MATIGNPNPNHKIEQLISYYEMREAMSMFELELWRAKLDGLDSILQ
jgi:hypothetical protein